MLHTALYQQHVALHCKLVPFGEWEMPLHYGSQIEEHHAVRKQAGLFDVSHMMITDLLGKGSYEFLRHLVANDIAKLQPGQALYTCLLNHKGGILDDAIVYFIDTSHYRLISNATTRDKIQSWLQSQQADFSVTLKTRDDLAILALQGPETFSILNKLAITSHSAETLQPFHIAAFESGLIARTGYTGELGVEIMLPHPAANVLWEKLINAHVQPCGLGARDTLRLEMGYNLYGSDMDESTTPLESNLKWTVSFTPERDFIGKSALQTQIQQGVSRHLTGLILQEKGIPRSHYEVFSEHEKIGEITSGSFSPSLNQGIALARLSQIPQTCFIKIRDNKIPALITKPPFYKGQIR